MSKYAALRQANHSKRIARRYDLGGIGNFYTPSMSTQLSSTPSYMTSSAYNGAVSGLGPTAGSGITATSWGTSGAGKMPWSTIANTAGTMVGNWIGQDYNAQSTKYLNMANNLFAMSPWAATPWGVAALFGGRVLEGVGNRAFGYSKNEGNISGSEQDISNTANTNLDASTNDQLLALSSSLGTAQGVERGMFGKDGWFRHKIKNLEKKYTDYAQKANEKAWSNLSNSAENIQNSQLQNMEANYAALGGPINLFAKGGSTYLGSDAIRNKIKNFEGSDYAGQVKQWGGDPVGAHAQYIIDNVGLNNWNKLTDNQKDALISYRYNTSVNAFKPTLTALKKYFAMPDGYAKQAQLDKVRQSINVGWNSKKYPGLRARRQYEQNLFASDYDANAAGNAWDQGMQATAEAIQDAENTQAVDNYLRQKRLNDILSAPTRGPQTISADTDLQEADTTLPYFWSTQNLQETPQEVNPLYDMYDQINQNQFASGGKIHIKHPGALTALKKRTGKTEAELYRTGNAHTRKMITFARNARKWHHALGGEINNHGANFNLPVTTIDAGGTHEQNPYEGVQVGTDSQGVPDVVEQGELIWNGDYVFSDRMKVPFSDLKDVGVKAKRNKRSKRGTSDLTYADVAKKLSKDVEQRPNDPISNDTLNATLSRLAASQEEARAKKLLSQLKREAGKEVEQQLALASLLAQPQEGIQQPIEQPQEMPQEGVSQQPVMQALGGRVNRFDNAGPLWEGANIVGGNIRKGNSLLQSPYKEIGLWDADNGITFNRDWNNLLDYTAAKDNPQNYVWGTGLGDYGYNKGKSAYTYDLDKSRDNLLNTNESLQKQLKNWQDWVFARDNDGNFTNLDAVKNWLNAYKGRVGSAYDAIAKQNNFYTSDGEINPEGVYAWAADPERGNILHKAGFAQFVAPEVGSVYGMKDADGNIHYYNLTPEQAAAYEAYGNSVEVDPNNPYRRVNVTLLREKAAQDAANAAQANADVNAAAGNGNASIPTESDILPTWMEYSGIVPLIYGVGKTLFGGATPAEKLGRAALNSVNGRSFATIGNVKAPLIGDYVRPKIFDRDYYINQYYNPHRLSAQRAYVGLTGGNRGAAQAGIMNLNNQYYTGLADLGVKAEQQNSQEEQWRKKFNRETNIQNGNWDLSAQEANARNRLSFFGSADRDRLAAYQMLTREANAKEADKAANLSALSNYLQNWGARNRVLNQINTNPAYNAGQDVSGRVYDKKAEAARKAQKQRAKAGKNKKCNGGFVNSKGRRMF